LKNGGRALIDRSDYRWASQFVWQTNKDGYVFRWQKDAQGKSRRRFLHRELIQAPASMQVHHHNRLRLDNRRSNLQALSPAAHRRLHAKETDCWPPSPPDWELTPVQLRRKTHQPLLYALGCFAIEKIEQEKEE